MPIIRAISSGAQGPVGMDGDSAYQVAVANGFSGTESEWLASLIGAAGVTGQQGLQGAQGPKGDQGDTGATGPQGPKGDQGDTATGPQGPSGATGATGPQGPKGDQGDTTAYTFNGGTPSEDYSGGPAFDCGGVT
jgi:hypothetical protein